MTRSVARPSPSRSSAAAPWGCGSRWHLVAAGADGHGARGRTGAGRAGVVVVGPDRRRARHVGPLLPRDPRIGSGPAGAARRRRTRRRGALDHDPDRVLRRRSGVAGVDPARLPRAARSLTAREGAARRDARARRDRARLARARAGAGRRVAHALVGARDVRAVLGPAARGEAGRRVARRERRVHLGDDPAPDRGAPGRHRRRAVRCGAGRCGPGARGRSRPRCERAGREVRRGVRVERIAAPTTGELEVVAGTRAVVRSTTWWSPRRPRGRGA